MFFEQFLTRSLLTYSPARAAIRAEDKVVKIIELLPIVSNLPEANVATLRVLLKHFLKVIDSSTSYPLDLPHLLQAWGTGLFFGTI